jgi:hypothetical protein
MQSSCFWNRWKWGSCSVDLAQGLQLGEGSGEAHKSPIGPYNTESDSSLLLVSCLAPLEPGNMDCDALYNVRTAAEVHFV